MRTALGESRLGEPALAQGLPLARAAADTTWLLKGMRWYGVALGYNLRNEEAHAVFAEMRQLAMAAGDSVHWAWAEVGLAYQDGRAGRTAAERQGYERAVDLFQHVGDVRGEIFARNGLGTLLMKVADFPAARASYLRTLTVARQVGYTYVEALAENNLGALEFGLGDPGRAEQHFRRAQELHRAEGNVKEALTAAHNVAVCLTWLGDLDSALTGLQQVRATSRREGFAEDEFSAVGQMAAVLRKQGRPGQAVALLDSMMTRPEPVTERNRLKLVQEKAAALELQDHREQARDLLLAAEASLPELGDPLMEAQYLTMLARLLAGTGHPRQALQRMQPLERANLASGLVEGAMLAALESGQAWRRLDRPRQRPGLPGTGGRAVARPARSAPGSRLPGTPGRDGGGASSWPWPINACRRRRRPTGPSPCCRSSRRAPFSSALWAPRPPPFAGWSPWTWPGSGPCAAARRGLPGFLPGRRGLSGLRRHP